ncbi:MAG: uracil-DNA glycosylase, partial [Alphaproteobacteria bacterium]
MAESKGRGSGASRQEVGALARDLAAQAEWQRMLGVVEASAAATGPARPAEPREPRSMPTGDAVASRPAPGSSEGEEVVTAAHGGSPGESTTGVDSTGASGRGVSGGAIATPSAGVPPPATAPSPAELAAARSLDGLRGVIGDCRRCRLHGARTQVVFGVGNPAARVVFVGEGPGRDEDLQGEPFVGRAGQLLTDIIEKGMRLSRADVYICNVVKCRPPQNRNPEPDEVATCSPFLFRQIELVEPEVLVTLGKFAAHALLSTDVPITRLRGQWQEFRGIPVMPTFHPAYLLRNPAEKKTVWQ